VICSVFVLYCIAGNGHGMAWHGVVLYLLFLSILLFSGLLSLPNSPLFKWIQLYSIQFYAIFLCCSILVYSFLFIVYFLSYRIVSYRIYDPSRPAQFHASLLRGNDTPSIRDLSQQPCSSGIRQLRECLRGSVGLVGQPMRLRR